MTIRCEIEIEVNDVLDEEMLCKDLDDCLGEFIMNNEQTYFASTKRIAVYKTEDEVCPDCITH